MCGNQTVATVQIVTYVESWQLSTASRLFAADGSLLFIVFKDFPSLNKNPSNGNDEVHILKCRMYHPLTRDFPQELHTSLHSAHAG